MKMMKRRKYDDWNENDLFYWMRESNNYYVIYSMSNIMKRPINVMMKTNRKKYEENMMKWIFKEKKNDNEENERK